MCSTNIVYCSNFKTHIILTCVHEVYVPILSLPPWHCQLHPGSPPTTHSELSSVGTFKFSIPHVTSCKLFQSQKLCFSLLSIIQLSGPLRKQQFPLRGSNDLSRLSLVIGRFQFILFFSIFSKFNGCCQLCLML